MIVKRILLIILVLYSGCSRLSENIPLSKNDISCSEDVMPRSLEFLEQQYHCSGKERER